MNLIFRLVTICCIYLFDQRKIDPLGVSELDFRVWPFDIDLNIHMNNGRYLSIMDLGRMDLLMRLGLTRHIFKNKWMPVLASAKIRYRIPLMPFQKFRLESRVAWWDDKWFYMEQRFIIVDGPKKNAVAAIAFVKGSFYDRKEKATVPTSDIQSLMHMPIDQTPEKPSYIDSWMTAEEDMRLLTLDKKNPHL